MTDKYQGQGGSYRIDPKTGERVLVQRTDEAGAVKAPEPSNEAPAKETDHGIA